MLESVSVPSLICMVLAGPWRLFEILDSFFCFADSAMCVALLVPEINARSGATSHWKSFKIRPGREYKSSEMKHRSVSGMSWEHSFSGTRFWSTIFRFWELWGNCRRPLWYHLFDLGCRFGAHWILKGSPKRQVSYKININHQKMAIRSGARKNMNLWWKTDAKRRCPDNPKRGFLITPAI